MNRYTVTYERDESGYWIARVHGVAGVFSDGRTIADARRRAREALSLAIGDEAAEAAVFVDDVKLPADARRALARAVAARRKAETSAKAAQENTAAAARELTRRAGLSMRDAADLLGLSHQRIQQLSRAHSRRAGATRRLLEDEEGASRGAR